MTILNLSLQPAKRLPTTELMLLAVACVWGTSYGFTKEALIYASVFLFLSLRFSITFVILAPYLIKELLTTPARAIWPIALLGICLFLIFIFETYGVHHTSAAKAAVLISCCVLITPFYEWLVFKVPPDRFLFGAVAACMLGIILISGVTQSLTAINIGDIAMLIAALLRAIMVVQSKKILTTSPLSALSVTAIQCGVVAISSILVLICSNGLSAGLPIAPKFWFIIGYLVFFCTLFAFFAQNLGVKKLGPTKAGLLMGTEPLFGALFAIYYLNETLTLLQSMGGLLIFLASLLTVTRTNKSVKNHIAKPLAKTNLG